MHSMAVALLVLLLSGCQINPYTFQPDWTSPSWFDAGKEDAMNGLPVKDNQALAGIFNDAHVDRSEYLRGYKDGQKKCARKDSFMPGDWRVNHSLLAVIPLIMRQRCMRHGKKERKKA